MQALLRRSVDGSARRIWSGSSAEKNGAVPCVLVSESEVFLWQCVANVDVTRLRRQDSAFFFTSAIRNSNRMHSRQLILATALCLTLVALPTEQQGLLGLMATAAIMRRFRGQQSDGENGGQQQQQSGSQNAPLYSLPSQPMPYYAGVGSPPGVYGGGPRATAALHPGVGAYGGFGTGGFAPGGMGGYPGAAGSFAPGASASSFAPGGSAAFAPPPGAGFAPGGSTGFVPGASAGFVPGAPTGFSPGGFGGSFAGGSGDTSGFAPGGYGGLSGSPYGG